MLTKREQLIVNAILESAKGQTIDELISRIQVSKRTMYRELSEIETEVIQHGLNLVKSGNRYLIDGEDELVSLFIKNEQTIDNPGDATVTHRQGLLLSYLLLANEPKKAQGLAIDNGVSAGTISTDLNHLDAVVEANQLLIQRKKGEGIKIIGTEGARRNLLSTVIDSQINTYQFFRLMHSDLAVSEMDGGDFIELLPKNVLPQIYQLIKPFIHELALSDETLQKTIITIGVAFERISANHLVTNLSQKVQDVSFENKKIAIQLFQQGPPMVKEYANMAEITFLGWQIQGLTYHKRQINGVLDDYNLNLSFQVKNLIQQISADVNFDFTKDQQLFVDLSSHLESYLNRFSMHVPNLSSAVMQQVKGQYKVLYEALTKRVPEILPNDTFSNDEIGYLVIHFASAYERKPKHQHRRVLIICANGLGTAQILKNRLLHYFPTLTDITVAKVSQLNQLDITPFDLILSTVHLPGFTSDYQFVTPLLSQETADEIGQLLAEKPVNGPTNLVTITNSRDRADFNQVFYEMDSANRILQGIDIRQVNNGVPTSIDTILDGVLAQLQGSYISDIKRTKQALIQRINQSPVGIPDTKMALIHATVSSVKIPYFSIYNLSEPIDFAAMDQTKIRLQRILLMLGPTEMSMANRLLMGRISSTIIENNDNLELFQNGNIQVIKALIGSAFLDEIKQMDGSDMNDYIN